MSFKARQEMLASIEQTYKASDRKTKNQLLDGFIAVTGYERKHAIKLLNGDINKAKQGKKRGKPPRYDEPVVKVLEMLWHASNQICSKRLIPFLPELVSSLEHHGHLRLTDDRKLPASKHNGEINLVNKCKKVLDIHLGEIFLFG